ncbi:MAG TPA: hypothetical protein VJZ27_03110 [Aggregatilineales bacterium]|nr:hypothetical protein [Aggregatilineales bacterium]
MDQLFGALIESEAEPTITLKELDKKALFADLHTQPVQAVSESLNDTRELNPDVVDKSQAGSQKDRLTGDELSNFLSKSIQKDMGKDIASDIDLVAGMFKPPKNMMRERQREQQEADSFLTKFVASLKRLIGR